MLAIVIGLAFIALAGWHHTLNRLYVEIDLANYWRNQATYWKHEANKISPNIYNDHHN